MIDTSAIPESIVALGRAALEADPNATPESVKAAIEAKAVLDLCEQANLSVVRSNQCNLRDIRWSLYHNQQWNYGSTLTEAVAKARKGELYG